MLCRCRMAAASHRSQHKPKAWHHKVYAWRKMSCRFDGQCIELSFRAALLTSPGHAVNSNSVSTVWLRSSQVMRFLFGVALLLRSWGDTNFFHRVVQQCASVTPQPCCQRSPCIEWVAYEMPCAVHHVCVWIMYSSRDMQFFTRQHVCQVHVSHRNLRGLSKCPPLLEGVSEWSMNACTMLIFCFFQTLRLWYDSRRLAAEFSQVTIQITTLGCWKTLMFVRSHTPIAMLSWGSVFPVAKFLPVKRLPTQANPISHTTSTL